MKTSIGTDGRGRTVVFASGASAEAALESVAESFGVETSSGRGFRTVGVVVDRGVRVAAVVSALNAYDAMDVTAYDD